MAILPDVILLFRNDQPYANFHHKPSSVLAAAADDHLRGLLEKGRDTETTGNSVDGTRHWIPCRNSTTIPKEGQ